MTATAADVRTECSRRMRALLGARDEQHLQHILINNTREAFRLHEKGPWWTLEDDERVRMLRQLDAAVEELRAASNRMEHNPPDDYADDRHWPRASAAASVLALLQRART